MLRVLSLGAGVQSTTMALLAARGEIGPMPTCAIFADTGWEPRAVYEHLDRLEPLLPFPVYRVTQGNLRDDLLTQQGSARAGRLVTVPFFIQQANGDKGMGRRQCTSHYKVEPVRKKTRELLGVGPRDRIKANSVEKWMGISVDEVIRATPSQVKFEVKRFPLLEVRMSRGDCIEWLKRNDFTVPPKSACIGCPFHTDANWRAMKDSDPASWADAVKLDAIIRKPLGKGRRGDQYMHRSMKPLDQVDLTTVEDHGQLNLFNLECEGMCGV